MFRDPTKVVDATKETRVEWQKEVAAGNLVPISPLVNDTSDKSCRHIQGRRVTDEEESRRIVPASVMKEVSETGRYPKLSGKLSFQGGWPSFDRNGNIIKEDTQ